MNKTGDLPDTLKEELVATIIASFLKDKDVADSMMGLAIELTEPFINPENQDLFSEVSGMVGYALADFFTRLPEIEETLPKSFDVKEAEKVVNGKMKALGALDNAFSWRDTPQGYSYWEDRGHGSTPLSNDDIAQIERWINIAKSQNL